MAARVRSEQLDRRVRLERRIEETDDSGQSLVRWLPLAEVWARAEPLGGREGFGQEQWVASGDVRFTVRWREDVTPLHRVVHEGREYDVVSVAEDGRRQALLIVARARTDGRR
jgi:SPP1 family predicted phage head-tail adaptor